MLYVSEPAGKEGVARTYLLDVRVVGSSTATSFPFPLAVAAGSRTRLEVVVVLKEDVAAAEDDDAAFALSFSFCFALTRALERSVFVSVGTVAAVGCWAGGGGCWCSWLPTDGFCWVKSI